MSPSPVPLRTIENSSAYVKSINGFIENSTIQEQPTEEQASATYLGYNKKSQHSCKLSN